jgi:hypothetical protein
MGWKRNREDKNEARKIIEARHGFGLFDRAHGKRESRARCEPNS